MIEILYLQEIYIKINKIELSLNEKNIKVKCLIVLGWKIQYGVICIDNGNLINVEKEPLNVGLRNKPNKSRTKTSTNRTV